LTDGTNIITGTTSGGRSVIFPEDRELVFTNYQKRLNGEDIDGHYQFRIINKNNEIRWIEISGARLEWHGKPATLNFLNDVTEKKVAEIELTKANERLEKLNYEKDRFFSIIAHDLRSPFLGFLGLTELFADEADSQSPEKLKSLGTEMNQKANNLYKLLKNLLEWSQMQQGVFNLQPKQLSLNDLISENIDLVKARSEQKGIELVNKAVNPIAVYADERMINSVLLNLLSNAVKFTHRHGSITVTARIQSNQTALIAVEDTGMGIHQRDLERLFKIGEKVGAIGTEGELSTGLGLILCREFVEKHGGKIWADSHAGKGSVFSFTLPLSGPNPISDSPELV
jgi:signal transduction histidine kinase